MPRRIQAILLTSALVAAPAAGLLAVCAGPSCEQPARAEVPVAFVGPGIEPRSLPDAFGLDDVAPTLAEIIGLRRPHPEVRSGQAVRRLWTQAPPRLAVEVVFKGVGTADIS